jgi:hypothetical protein
MNYNFICYNLFLNDTKCVKPSKKDKEEVIAHSIMNVGSCRWVC